MEPTTLEIEFLGTGTSTGVPMVRCHCPVCMSADPRDKRLRTSAIVRYQGARILIDCGPDFRAQMLRASDDNLDAVLLTHIHYDHVAGIDDLRSYCFERPFPMYARADVLENLHRRIPYCFAENPYPGVPRFEEHVIDDKPFLVEGCVCNLSQSCITNCPSWASASVHWPISPTPRPLPTMSSTA